MLAFNCFFQMLVVVFIFISHLHSMVVVLVCILAIFTFTIGDFEHLSTSALGKKIQVNTDKAV